MKNVLLPITEVELGDAISTARKDLMSVVTQRDAATRLVFQTGIDVDEESAAKALQTLAKAGARLFQRIFSGRRLGSKSSRWGNGCVRAR